MLIDLVFLTNLYQRKHPVKRYWAMIVMVTVLFAESCVFTVNALVFAYVLSMLGILWLFTKDKLSLVCFCLVFAIASMLEVFILESINIGYYRQFLLQAVIKMAGIVIVFKKLSELTLKIELETITQKVLWISFSFFCLCAGTYAKLNWG